MREIKFRGKPIEDYGRTKWFYGNLMLSHEDKLAYIESTYQGAVPVEWDSVGQYTGFHDKHSKEIYEGDAVEGIHRHFEWKQKEKVFFLNGCFMIGNWNAHEFFNRFQHINVIGNIYENLELLEGDSNE